jgi:hypothetical protein
MSTDGERRRPEPGTGPSSSQPASPAPEPVELPADPVEPAPYADEPKGEKSEDTTPLGGDAEAKRGGAEAKGDDAEQTGTTRRTGRIRAQDPENTVPREPTLAERRAREQALRREKQAEQARLAEEARRKKVRKRVLIGGGVTVGVVALIAVGYAASRPDEVQARCVDENNVVASDDNCVQPAPAAAASHYGGGFIPFPIFIGGGGRQYHYNYGGTGGVGQVATGGTTVAPKNATVVTQSGRTIQRGGFGVSRSTGGSGGG